jgi:hypothetical protein
MRIWPTKRGWKRFGLGLAILVALAFIVNGFFAWRAEWRLRSRLAAIRAAGDPASLAELAPVPIPDDQNAAAILERIRPRMEEFSKAYGRFYNSPIGKQYEATLERGEPATKEQIDAIRAILTEHADVEQAIASAAACEKYASRMDFTLGHTDFIEKIFPSVQNARTATRFLCWNTYVVRADGMQEVAIKNGIQSLRLARLHESEPTLVAYLVSVAMRGIASEQLYDDLASGPVSPELHTAIDEELARHEDPNLLANVLKSERAFGADWIKTQLAEYGSLVANILGWPMKSCQVGVLDAMEEYVQLTERPWHEVRREFGLPGASSRPTGHGVMADQLVPAIQAVFEAHARSLVVSRSLRIDNALRAFAEKNGREARGLDELNLPREATIDPYSGQPLKLKHADEGWLVYSVMQNGVDDGGNFKEMKDYGVAPPKWRLTE